MFERNTKIKSSSMFNLGVEQGAKKTVTTENPDNEKKQALLEELKEKTLKKTIENIEENIKVDPFNREEKARIKSTVIASLNEVLETENKIINRFDRDKIVDDVIDEITGYGPIDIFLHDPEITEVMVNGPKRVYIEKKGRLVKSNVTFRDDEHVRHTIEKIISPLGRRLDETSPMVDARLPDGSRVNAIVPPPGH